MHTIEINSQDISKEKKYKNLLPQLEALISGEDDLIANLANISSALKEVFEFFWVGFYLVKNKQLVLGPFQGTVACTRINYGKGVCGSAWKEKKSLIVGNVDEFPGHIACSSLSKSEIVVPIFNGKEIIGILDIDSDKLNNFDAIDQKYLEKLTGIIKNERNEKS